MLVCKYRQQFQYKGKTMKKLNVAALALAACLSVFALPASADLVWTNETVTASGPLGQAWTGVWDGDNSWNIGEGLSEVSILDATVSYYYGAGGSWAGTPTQTYVFKTAATGTGALTLGIDLVSNEAWNGSATGLYVWQGSTAHKTLLSGGTDGNIVHVGVTLDLQAGEEWGFLAASGSIGDDLRYSGPVWGSFTITDPGTSKDVPEPASLALLGLGVLGIAAARRKKA